MSASAAARRASSLFQLAHPRDAVSPSQVFAICPSFPHFLHFRLMPIAACGRPVAFGLWVFDARPQVRLLCPVFPHFPHIILVVVSCCYCYSLMSSTDYKKAFQFYFKQKKSTSDRHNPVMNVHNPSILSPENCVECLYIVPTVCVGDTSNIAFNLYGFLSHQSPRL